MWVSTLIVVALWLLIMIAAIVFRQQLFINPMLAAISSILFEPTDDKRPQSTDIIPTGKEVRDE